MRKLHARPIVPLPDKFWISSEEFRVAVGRSPHLWRRIDLPVLRDYFPPIQLGPNGIGDARWRLDDIGQRYPHLVSHLTSGTTVLDRFKQRQREATAAYLASSKTCTAKQMAA
jgi:hypothetical protein